MGEGGEQKFLDEPSVTLTDDERLDAWGVGKNKNCPMYGWGEEQKLPEITQKLVSKNLSI